MMWLSLLAELEERIDNDEIDQFDEVDKELLKKILDNEPK